MASVVVVVVVVVVAVVSSGSSNSSGIGSGSDTKLYKSYSSVFYPPFLHSGVLYVLQKHSHVHRPVLVQLQLRFFGAKGN